MTLLRWYTFLVFTLNMTLIVLLLWIYVFLLMPVFVLPWISLYNRNSGHVVASVSIDLQLNSKGDAPFHCMTILVLVGRVFFHDHLRDVPWEDILKLGTSAAATEFCEWVQVGIGVYISHCKYQVKRDS